MAFETVINTVLPTQNGTQAHITGNYGETRENKPPHGGTDFNYLGGQTGINMTNPTIYSPVNGRVTMVGGVSG